MKEVRGEFAAMVLKFMDRGLIRGNPRSHAAIIGHLVAFLRVTPLTGGDDIVP